MATRVAVTDISLVTPFSEDTKISWDNIVAGNSAISKIIRFDTSNLNIDLAGCINYYPEAYRGSAALTEKLAFSALNSLSKDTYDSYTGFVLALPPLELDWATRFMLSKIPTYAEMLKKVNVNFYESINISNITKKLKFLFNFAGHPIVVNTACASGATAITLGINAINSGIYDRVVVVAADGSITQESMIRFSLLGALSQNDSKNYNCSRPFDKNRNGFVMAEGAAAFVLERAENVKKRGEEIIAYISGSSEVTDNFHLTRASNGSYAAIKAIKQALSNAQISIFDIDSINAHATGTKENDKSEYQALYEIFGDRLSNIYVTANKSILGHCLSAAGAIEIAISCLSVYNSIIPPTINCDDQDHNINLNIVKKQPLNIDIKHILSNSFGFGGQNSCVIVSKFDT